jgi:methyltransferase (TIGR00027 family)
LVTIPESLAGVGLTAVGVALIRARESGRSDRLFDDPYAQLFADAAHADFTGPDAPAGAGETWAKLQELVDMFYEGRVIVTRHFDDMLLEAVAAGCGQVVVLGAGLDTRALRLPLPDSLPVYELDLPPMFEFKERVLAEVENGHRVVVPTDLRGDWQRHLRAAGFEAGLPTVWVEEGVLAYLPDDAVREVLATVTSLSAPGSRLAKSVVEPDLQQPAYRKMRSFVGGAPDATAGVRGTERDLAFQLEGSGWRLTVRRHNDLARSYGRPTSDRDRASYLTATRV